MEKLLKNWVLPKTMESGCFGEGSVLEKFVIDQTHESTGDQFASEVVFVELYVKRLDGEIKTYEVIIKVQLQDERFRNLVNSSLQFENEIFMYDTIIPMLDHGNVISDLCCKYYYGYVDPEQPTKDFIVLEDLRSQGYRPSKERVFLDYEHCAAALKELGRFHALSYIKKSKDFEKLLSAAENIKDKFTPESLVTFQETIELCAKRGIQPLIDKGESVELLQSLLCEYKDLLTFFPKLVKATEPEAVLCHGDFNRNNLLFRYDENQRVIGVKFIDFQTPRYASPGIDISFLMCMNMTHALRNDHLNDLLNIYHESLRATVGNNSIVPDIDLSRSAVYGFIISSFFLPIMMAEQLSVEEVLSDDLEEGFHVAHTRGGQKETQVIVEAVRDLVTFNFIRKSYD